MVSRIYSSVAAAILLALAVPAVAQAAQNVQLESMTSPEVRALIGQGYKTIIIPTGGTEQNGPHLTLGKHNTIVTYTAEKAAQKLGNTLVAPTIKYVPEGKISPAEGHMRFAGTISLRESTFAAMLEDTARSFKQHGFKLICFLSDHGGSIGPQEEVAERLTHEWRKEGVTVLAVSEYYTANGQEEWVESLKKNIATPGAHGGFADTSELEAIDPSAVYRDRMLPYKDGDFDTTGVKGDPSPSSAEYGQKLLEMKVDAAVRQIKHDMVFKGDNVLFRPKDKP